MIAERKEEILQFLKRRGRASLSDLAVHLGMSKQGALRHLDALQDQGLVEFTSEGRPGPGRREHVYRLAPPATDRFPQAHRQLSGELVSFMPKEQLDAFFRNRAERLESEYRQRLGGLGFEARVRELARLATEHGHMAEVEEVEGGFAIRQCNCPIADVAGAVGHPCHHEQEMYRRVLGAEVTRETFIPDSDPSCTYVIREAPPHAAGGVPRGRRPAPARA